MRCLFWCHTEYIIRSSFAIPVHKTCEDSRDEGVCRSKSGNDPKLETRLPDSKVETSLTVGKLVSFKVF